MEPLGLHKETTLLLTSPVFFSLWWRQNTEKGGPFIQSMEKINNKLTSHLPVLSAQQKGF